MNTKQVLVLLETGFEEIETVAPVDILRRAGAEVVLSSVGGELLVEGKTGMALLADRPLADCDPQAFDALVIPGGPAAKALRGNAAVLDLVRSFHSRNLLIGAICAAPTVLLAAGILEKKNYTAHFSVEEDLPAILPDPVVADGNILTSRGAGTAVAFGLALVERLFGAEAAAKIASSICVPKETGH